MKNTHYSTSLNAHQYVIEFDKITKSYHGVKVNDQISFKVKRGTIHALIGENGAGKSTLMSILFGLVKPDSGTIIINGHPKIINSPYQAHELGIGMVHQHFKLVDAFSALENIILGQEISNKFNTLDFNKSLLKIKSLQRVYSLDFNLNQKVEYASVATKQKIEIMKMLYCDNEIMILDEPTAVLTEQEIQGLLKTLKDFKKQGKTVLFISHKLQEVLQVADSATVLRLGKVVEHYDRLSGVSTKQLANAMMGKELVEVSNKAKNLTNQKVIFEFQNISTKGIKPIKDLSFKVYAGEILAVAGVSGNGQEEIELVAAGLKRPVSGKVLKWYYPDNQPNGVTFDLTHQPVKARYQHRINYVPGDLHKYGVVLDLSVKDNLILRKISDRAVQKMGWIKQKYKQKNTESIITSYDVRGARKGSATMRVLSGGNQQKFVLGREINDDFDLLIIVQPTRGLDLGTTHQIWERILTAKKNQKAVLLISYELEEIMALADRILVINQGVKTSLRARDQFDRQTIGLMMGGVIKD